MAAAVRSNVDNIVSPFDISKYINATAGSTISLECSTDASRPAVPAVDWKYHPTVQQSDEYICLAGKVMDDYVSRFRLQKDKTTLVIDNINVNDTGIYYCIEDNAEGVRNTMYLTVHKILPAAELGGLPTWAVVVVVVFLVALMAVILVAILVKYLKCRRNKGSKLSTTDDRVAPYLVHTFRSVGTARGFETLDGKLCLLCEQQKLVRVYDIADGYKQVQSISVPGLRQTVDTGMMACTEHHCLYISDAENRCIHQVRLDDESCTKWTLDRNGSPRSVSVTLDHNVLVVCYSSSVLRIFSPDGLHLPERDVICPAYFGTIYHAIEFGENDQFVVAHSNSPQLSIVRRAGDGKVTSDTFANGLSTPRHLIPCEERSLLAVCFTSSVTDGNVVFDKGSTKLMLLGQEPDAAEPMCLVSHDDGLVCKPMRVCYDSAHGLFVGDGDGRGDVRLYRWDSLNAAVANRQRAETAESDGPAV